MANRECNVTKRVKVGDGLRYCPVILSANGRIKPDTVLVNGKPEHHTEGAYYLEWREGSKRIRQSVGNDAGDATARRLRKEAELNALNNGVSVVPERQRSAQRLIAEVAVEYLAEIKMSRNPATHSAYTLALRNFAESCSKTCLEEIDRTDLLHFITYLRDQALSDRTCHNRFEHLLTFLKAYGITGLARKRDWPKFVQREPESYEDEELDKFFAVCDEEERSSLSFT